MGMTTVSPDAEALARLADATASDAALRTFLHGLPGVDAVGAQGRAAALAKRSIKAASKAQAIDLAIRMVDLTTLEGQDTPGKVRALATKAQHPDPSDPTCPQVAAVCVYPDMVATAKEAVRGSGIHVASVATAFPSGRASRAVKIADVRDAVAAGADEIDMVIDIGRLKSGDVAATEAEIRAVREAAPAPTVLKVIIESAVLTDEEIVAACRASEAAGADFVKTSTGMHPAGGASVHAVELMARTVGGRLGVKASGGVRTAEDAAAMIAAGATRLGVSGSRALLEGLK